MGFPKGSPYKIWRGVPRGRGRAGARPSRMVERVPPAWPCASHPQGGLSPTRRSGLWTSRPTKVGVFAITSFVNRGASSISTIRKRHELNHHGRCRVLVRHLIANEAIWYNMLCSAVNCGTCLLTYRLVVSRADGRHEGKEEVRGKKEK